MDDGAGKESGARQYTNRIAKKYCIMRFLFFQPDHHACLHAISQEVGQKMKTTLRDQDVRELLDELISKGMVEMVSVSGTEVGFRISEFGTDWWRLHGQAVLQLL